MSSTGLPIFDDTLQQTNRWINEILDHINEGTWDSDEGTWDSDEGTWDSDDKEEEHRQRAYNALRAVLLTLRDRIPTGLSANLSAQLPLLVRGIYYDQYEPEHQPQTYRNAGAFYEHVAQRVDPQFHFDAEESTKAVFAVLSSHLPEGTAQKVREALPEDVRNAWASLETA